MLTLSPILATTNSGVYKVFLFVHILAVIAAFGPGLLYALGVRGGLHREVTDAHTRISIPAIVVVGIAGFGLVGLSDKVWKFSQIWVSLGGLIWLLVVLDAVLLLRPALAGATAGDDKSKGRVAMATGLLHLGMVVAVFLMVFKPGAPGGL
jgi:hypothetical protein